MAKILSYNNKRNNLIIVISLAISIAITNSFILFSLDEDSRFYFSNLTSTLTVGVPLVIAFVMVFRYKRSMKNRKSYLKYSHTRTRVYTIIMIITECICRYVFSWCSGLLPM